MKLLRYLVLALCLPALGQQINLRNPQQVKGQLPPANGGIGNAPTAADQIPISFTSTVAAWVQLYNCAADGAHALTYSTSAHQFQCATLTTGSSSWASLSSGTSAQTFVMGSGGTLGTSGTGQIAANYLNSVAISAIAPTTGYALIATSAGTAAWSAFSGGSVTSFAAPSGSWPSWLVPTVTNASSTPSLAVAASAIPNSALANSSTTINGSTCALGGSCTVPSAQFSTLVGGTNSSAQTFTVGSTSAMTYSGSGTINASHLGGVAANLFPVTNSTNTFTGGQNAFIASGTGNGVILSAGGAFLNSSSASDVGGTIINYPSPNLWFSSSVIQGTTPIMDQCIGAYNPGAGSNPNMIFNFGCGTSGGSTGTHTIAFGNPVTAPSVNNSAYADVFSGPDEGAKITAAFASLGGTSGNPSSAAKVALSPSQTYTVATAFNIPNQTSSPYIIWPTLDCQGSTLNYTGSSADFISVLEENSNGPSATIKNCIINNGSGNTSTVNLIHQFSRVGVNYENDQINANYNTGGNGLLIENVSESSSPQPWPGYNERTVISNVTFQNNTSSLTYLVSTGTNSLARQEIDAKCNAIPNQNCMTVAGPVGYSGGLGNGAYMYHSSINLRGNMTNGTNSSLVVERGAAITGSIVNLGFEPNPTSAGQYLVNVQDVVSGVYGDYGILAGNGIPNYLCTGSTPCTTDQINVFDPSNGGFLAQNVPYANGLAQAGNSKFCVINGTGCQDTVRYGIPSIAGIAGAFQLYQRLTTNPSDPEVDAAPSTGNMQVNIAYCVAHGGCGFGPGYGISATTGGTTQPTHPLEYTSIGTQTNCVSAAGPAVCGSAPTGAVIIAAGSGGAQVNTTAVTANSRIFIQEDSTLGGVLGVTCNTTAATISQGTFINVRTAGTSFSFSITTAPVTNPACYSYTIIN
jgi:hypothetical protein